MLDRIVLLIGWAWMLYDFHSIYKTIEGLVS